MRSVAWGIGVFLIGVLAFNTLFLSAPSDSADTIIRVAVASGEGIDDIAAQLERAELIRTAKGFIFYGILSGSAHRLKPGVYEFSPAMSVRRIMARLVYGPEDVQLVIPEGKAMADIDALLSTRGVLLPGAFLELEPSQFPEYAFLDGAESLEGFLFPDTYRIQPDAVAEAVARKMLNAFRDKALPLFPVSEAPGAVIADAYDALILASLLEKEVPEFHDRRIVSGILRKRLGVGMALQVDATVVYAVCEGSFDTCGGLTREDYMLQSVFNTYVHRGLPPAPIANPGVAAIEAALAPEPSPYLYYLSDQETGETIFSKTLEEHNEARERYLH
jgi:UPF0755 protein